MTSLWVPLIVAVVGVLGTLSAAIFTQIWAANRENQRWAREQAVQEKRWKQEQDDRYQQWKREDRTRWLEERRAIYAEFLLCLKTLDEEIGKAEREQSDNKQINESTLSQMNELVEKAIQTCQHFRLIAPRKVVDLGECVMFSQVARKFNLEGTVLEGPGDSIERTRESDRLFEAIRLDLGLDY